jgi:hypothetical protein
MKTEKMFNRFPSKGWLITAAFCAALVFVMLVDPFEVQAGDPETEIAMWAEIVQMKQMEYSRDRNGNVWDLRLLSEMALIEAEQYDREIGLSFKDQVYFVRDLFPEQHYTVIAGDDFFLSVKVPTTLEGREIDEEGAWIDLVFSGNTITITPDKLLGYLGYEAISGLRGEGQGGGRGR